MTHVEGWRGYDPARVTGLYPTAVATDYAFIGFGGGALLSCFPLRQKQWEAPCRSYDQLLRF